MDPVDAKRRIRVLRFYGYRCQYRDRPGAPICGAPAGRTRRLMITNDPYTDLIAACRRHAKD